VIRTETAKFTADRGFSPRVLLLENHGLITVGSSPEAVKASMFMTQKAAEIFVGSASLGGPSFLSAGNVARIANRTDEHYRQRALKL
jgi:ribulose-5-phosphate 4-epimerase/fuculose-1-phosphate aldolase